MAEEKGIGMEVVENAGKDGISPGLTQQKRISETY